MKTGRPAVCLLAMLLLLAFSVSVVVFTPTDAFAKKKVKLQFEPGWCPPLKGGGTCNSASVQSRIMSKFEKVHTFAGTNLSIVTNCTITDFHKVIKFVAGTHADGAGVLGYEPPCKNTGYVYGGAFKSWMSNCTALGRGMGNIAAHEHAHHWRVAHADALTNNIMQSRFNPDRAARSNLTFDATARGKFNTFLKTCNKTKADPEVPLGNKAEKVVMAVYGYHELGEDEKFADPYAEGITVTFSGNYFLYDFGWLTPGGDFVSQINAGQPTGRLTLYGAEKVDFALRNVDTREIHTVGSCEGTLTFLPPVFPGDLAEMPVLAASAVYYGGVQIDFPALAYSAILQANTDPDGFVRWSDTFPEQPGFGKIGVILLFAVLATFLIWRLRSSSTARAS